MEEERREREKGEKEEIKADRVQGRLVLSIRSYRFGSSRAEAERDRNRGNRVEVGSNRVGVEVEVEVGSDEGRRRE